MKKLFSLAFVVLFLAVVIADFYYTDQFESTNQNPVRDDAAIQTLIRTFGNNLKQVPLLAAKADTNHAMQTYYAPYLTPELLAAWQNDPELALGKLTSSPWPDHISDIFLRKNTNDTYSVSGNIVEMTSDDIAHNTEGAKEPVLFTVKQTAQGWRIADAQMVTMTLPTTLPTATKTTTAKPLTTVIPPLTSWLTFKNSELSLLYPANFQKFVDSNASGGGFLDTPIVKLSFPENAFANDNTNFSEAYLVVSKSKEKLTNATCSAFTGTLSPTLSGSHQETVNGVNFVEKDMNDAAAGNIYESKVYRVFHTNTCYEIVLTLHTGNIHNFDAGVQEFDKAKAFDVLKQILHTFHFAS